MENYLEQAKEILLKISINPKNKKFEKLPISDFYRAKQLELDNNSTKDKKFIHYKKGTIIFVDFGTGVGGEFSSPHFAIVLDKNDHPKKETLTVIPLTSKEKPFFVNLGGDLIKGIVNKIKLDLQYRTIFTKNLEKLIGTKTGVYYPDDKNTQKYFNQLVKQYYGNRNITIPEFIKILAYENKKTSDLIDLYENHMKNTFANVRAITTISKYRILKPKNSLDPIGKIRIPLETMQKLEKEIIKNYINSSSLDK